MDESARPTPRVSVVMPVFNGELFLAEAIESVLSQTLRDLELVAVDDASNDDSRAILDDFIRADSRVRLVANDRNLGVSATLNRGWREARAAYIAVAHADDIALPDRLFRQVAFLDAHPSVAVVGGAVITIGPTGQAGSIMRFPINSRMIHSTLLRHNCIAHPSAMLRRAAIDEVGGYRFDYVEDYDLWLRMSDRFDLANLPEPIVLYRIHSGQLSLLALEAREMMRLALRESAQARRASQDDPLAGVSELTPAILDRIGLDSGELARAVAEELLGRAVILADFDADGALLLVAQAARTLGSRATSSYAAAAALKKADVLLGSGRPLAGATHVLLACRHDPRYAVLRLTAWLRDRLPAPRLWRWS